VTGTRTLKGRGAPLFLLVVSVLLVAVSLGFGYAQQIKARTELHTHLRTVAREETVALANYFERARSIVLLTARNPSFADFYEAPGSRRAKIAEGGPVVGETNQALDYLQELYPTSIGESCFIDVGGGENSRVVRGVYAQPDELSPDESANPFFDPTFAMEEGQVYQAEPYVSPDTGEWVISNSTPMPWDEEQERAIVHYEVTVESFRIEAEGLAEDTEVVVLDERSGQVVIDSSRPQVKGAGLGRGPDEGYAGILSSGSDSGLTEIDGAAAAFRRLPATEGNANRWIVVATSEHPFGFLASVGVGPPGMLLASLVLLTVGIGNFRTAQRELTTAALTDGLTGLGNRRQLMATLEDAIESATLEQPIRVAIFDLDGFKSYNDAFGHPAGDALLQRLSRKLKDMVGRRGTVYRLGGDEFCLLTGEAGGVGHALVEAASMALSERGEGFMVTSSKGSCLVPTEAREVSEALRIADTRMYAEKLIRRPSPERQSRDVLLRALQERYPELSAHLEAVGEYAEMVGRHLGLEGTDLAKVRRAGELHDVGKVAIPDVILRKPGPLDEEEWAFLRRHSLVGERILEAAPSLSNVAKLVRAHHERWDGSGYPSGLAGEDIPLGARIVAVCDAYHAMVAGRAYQRAKTHGEALAELREFAGTQFDASVVEAFCEVVNDVPPPDHLDALTHGHEYA
jgi:diguanylate cyclase (GGDEF)-like protein